MTCECELTGVVGTVALRAVSGVGALIWDFFGVSAIFERLLSRLVDDPCDRLLGVPTLLIIFARRPAVMNGWRIAD